MTEMNVSIGLGVDTTAYEQGISRAEQLLSRLSNAMTQAVSQAAQMTGEIADGWQGINSSILQAVRQAGALAAMSIPQPAPMANGSVQPAAGMAGYTAGRAAAQAAAPAAGQTAGIDAAALSRSVAAALNGMAVNLDGERVGTLVAPEVNRQIAAAAAARRFSTI